MVILNQSGIRTTLSSKVAESVYRVKSYHGHLTLCDGAAFDAPLAAFGRDAVVCPPLDVLSGLSIALQLLQSCARLEDLRSLSW
jgi:hypothetical protein